MKVKVYSITTKDSDGDLNTNLFETEERRLQWFRDCLADHYDKEDLDGADIHDLTEKYEEAYDEERITWGNHTLDFVQMEVVKEDADVA